MKKIFNRMFLLARASNSKATVQEELLAKKTRGLKAAGLAKASLVLQIVVTVVPAIAKRF